MSQSRLLSALEQNVDGALQMSYNWIDKNLSGAASNLVKTLEDLLGSEIPGGEGPASKALKALMQNGEMEFYLLRGVRYSGKGWQLRGFRLLHIGGDGVGLADGSEIPGISDYYPHTAPFLPDP